MGFEEPKTPKNTPEGESQHDMNWAMREIHGRIQMARDMGKNEVEWDNFASIEHDLKTGVITPEEAVAKAQGVLESKSDWEG